MAEKRTFLIRIGRETYCDDYFYVRAESVSDVRKALGRCTRYSDDDLDDVPEDVRKFTDDLNGYFDDRSRGIVSGTNFTVQDVNPIKEEEIDSFRHPLIEI